MQFFIRAINKIGKAVLAYLCFYAVIWTLFYVGYSIAQRRFVTADEAERSYERFLDTLPDRLGAP